MLFQIFSLCLGVFVIIISTINIAKKENMSNVKIPYDAEYCYSWVKWEPGFTFDDTGIRITEDVYALFKYKKPKEE